MRKLFQGQPPRYIKEWLIDSIQPANDKLRLVVETTSDYKKSGIYSAQRDDTSKPVVIDWGDGTVENVNGDVSQKVHTYASVGTFNVVVENIKSYAASTNNSTWYNTTSQNIYTLKEVVAMPDSVTTIGDSAFYSCWYLTSVIIHNNVTSIGAHAFTSCLHLINVIISNSVLSIGERAFSTCETLTNVTIGNGIQSIGYKAFYDCSSLVNLVIQKTVAETENMYNTWFETFAYSSFTVTCTDGSCTFAVSCILKGTDILLSDGTTKKIEDLTYDDMLKVWDFDEGQLGSAKVCWLIRSGLKNSHYYQLTFDNGTVLKTTGINSNHRIFSVDQNKFTNVCDAKVGDKVFSIDGTLTITDVKYVEEECEYYNVMTAGKINCFANGILTSDRYGNLYPIVDMKYVKNGRSIRPYSEYETAGIDRYWYDNLRLGENTETVDKSKEYVWKCIGQMLPIPTN